jgi:hypothetical protein
MVRPVSIVISALVAAGAFALPAYPMRDSVAIMPLHTGATAGDSAADGTAAGMRVLFDRLGRYSVLPDKSLSPMIAQMYTSDNSFDRERFIRDKNLSMFVSVSIVPRSGKYLGILEILPAGGRVKTLYFESTIVSVVMLGMEREIISLHAKTPIRCAVMKKLADGKYLLDEGDAAGLVPGKTCEGSDGERVSVLQTARNSSLVRSSVPLEGTVVLKEYPDTGEFLNENDRLAEKEIMLRYSSESTVLSGASLEKRFVESVLIINPLSNIILPGFGASLSTSYMGFSAPRYSYAGIGMTLAFESYQLLYTPKETGWKGNFFPWVNDSDKSARQLRYQRYLWGTIPLTWTVAYMDQLSAQYTGFNVLPPFFDRRDSAACSLSLIIPGGGLFYKGYRSAGWSVYTAEFASMGYYVRNRGERKARYGLYACGGVKLAELALAYFLPPSYMSYTDGKGSRGGNLRFTLENDPGSGRAMYKLGLETGW